MALTKLLTAVRFLTVLPISWHAGDDLENFSSCLVFFPVVGMMIGFVGFIGAKVALLFLPAEVVAVLALVYLAFISGCLHLDGLADSADGLLSSRPRSERLAIMKDSRTGAMGVIAVVCVMLTKYASLGALAPDKLCFALFFMPLAGRCAILLSMSVLPYARAEGGLGRLFYSVSSRKAAFIGCSMLAGLLALFTPTKLPITLFGIFSVNMAFAHWCRSRLGGATGDTLGAICELTETITAVSFAAFFTFF